MVEAAPSHDAQLIASAVSYPESGTRSGQLIEIAARLLAEKDGPKVRSARMGGPALTDAMLVASPAMRKVSELVIQIARTNAPVLIRGETGTGKELVADSIQRSSRRAEGPFRRVNCGAITPTLIESTLFGHEKGSFTGADAARAGLFEQAHGGTLFLDEIGELSLAAQVALLRVLESGVIVRVGGIKELTVDVRVIAATHRDLEGMAKQNQFRLDLFHRLNTFVIELPPLRHRRSEIQPLANRFLVRANQVHDCSVRGFSPDAMAALEAYAWPGNVRELRNVVERAVVMTRGEWIQPSELPSHLCGEETTLVVREPEISNDLTFKERMQRYERTLMLEALRGCGGNKAAAARQLNMPLRTFMNKCVGYGLDDEL
jgi:two-component system, NtrC family, response regulator AtoC